MADTITVPDGTPGDITSAAGKLKKIAGDLDKHATMITAEQSGMNSHWHGVGGRAAATEAGTVASAATKYGTHLNDGANALTTFANALQTAQTNIGTLKKQADAIPGEALSEASSHQIFHHIPPADQESWVDAIVTEKMAPLLKKYTHEKAVLRKAGTTCKSALTNTIPGYKDGMTPGQVTALIGHSLESTLPILHGHNQAVTFTRIMADGKISESERKQLAAIAHDLAAHKDNAAYLKEFYSDVPKGSIQKLPLALHKMHDGPTLTDSDKDLIGDFGTSLAALSRIGGNHEEGEGYQIAKRALGDLTNGDLIGVGLLFKYSTRGGRSGAWNSVLSAQAAEGALLWKQTHPSYYYAEGSYSGQVFANGGGKDGDDYWFKDWGMKWGEKEISDYDAALNILGNINTNHDDWAARKLASDPLPKDLPVNYAVPDGMSHNGGNTGTYVDLLVVPDWLDNGKAAGDTLKLATEVARTGPDGRISASIMQNVMKDTAWWEHHKSDVRDAARNNFAAASNFGIHKGNDWRGFDLGDGMTNDLAHMAVQYIPALAGDQNAANGDHADIDPVTGAMFRPVSGDTATGFMQAFIGEKKYRVTLLGAGEEWSRGMVARGLLDHGLTTQQAAQQSGWLYGNVAKSYGDVLGGENADMTKAHDEVSNDLKFARDAFTTVTGFAGPETTIPNFMLTKFTDQMFSDYDHGLQQHIQQNLDQAAQFSGDMGGTAYSNTASALYLDRHHEITVGDQKMQIGDIPIETSDTGGTPHQVKLSECFNTDGTVKKQYAGDMQDWLSKNTADLTGGSNSTDPVTGSKVVNWYESAFDHNA